MVVRGKIERKGGKIVKLQVFSLFYSVFLVFIVVYDTDEVKERFFYPLASLGSIPNCSLKHLVKYFGSLNPTA